jgi:hypothetical protein
MDQLEAEARAGTMFSTLRSRLDRVTPDDVYAALEASVIDLNSRGRGVWL